MNDAWMEGFEKLGVWVHCVVVVEASRRRLGWGMGGLDAATSETIARLDSGFLLRGIHEGRNGLAWALQVMDSAEGVAPVQHPSRSVGTSRGQFPPSP